MLLLLLLLLLLQLPSCVLLHCCRKNESETSA
jgi:hypothetical protein